MSKFKLAARKTKETARYVLDGVFAASEMPIVLIGRHAGRSNKAYTSALLKVMQDRQLAGKATLARVDASDAAHIKLFSKHVFTGWENVFDAAGKAVPFSPEDCAELLADLCEPDQYPELVGANGALDRYFSDADNFRDEPVGDAEELGKR